MEQDERLWLLHQFVSGAIYWWRRRDLRMMQAAKRRITWILDGMVLELELAKAIKEELEIKELRQEGLTSSQDTRTPP